jgi:hypothetical protein
MPFCCVKPGWFFWCWLPHIFPGSQLSGIYRMGFLYVATEIDAHTWTANDPYFEGFDPESGGLRHCRIWLIFTHNLDLIHSHMVHV